MHLSLHPLPSPIWETICRLYWFTRPFHGLPTYFMKRAIPGGKSSSSTAVLAITPTCVSVLVFVEGRSATASITRLETTGNSCVYGIARDIISKTGGPPLTNLAFILCLNSTHTL